MKGFFVFFLATAIVSVCKADDKSHLDIHRGWNSSHVPPSRIIQGSRAILGQFPFQVHLTMSFANIVSAACGGSIIATRWVLTAAHCLVFLDLILGIFITYTDGIIEAGSVVAGSSTSQKRTVESVHPHESYNGQTLENDIGLLYTTEDFTFSRNVRIIPFVAYNANAGSDDYVDQFITVSGFGYTSNGGPVSPNLMYTNQLASIPFSECQKQFSNSLPKTSFCVQDPSEPYSALCSGDSGGPGTLVIRNVRTQIGVVSYAASECDQACQGLTHVALYSEWILDTIFGMSTL